MFEIDKTKTASFSGHRVLSHSERVVAIEVEKEIRNLYAKGVENFLCGMAMGFDILCGEIVIKLKSELPNIKLIAIIPCVNQAVSFPKREKDRYFALKQNADEILYTGTEYTFDCMHRRNRFLIDNSSFCICYLMRSNGGTFYTVNYANAKEVQIIDARPKQF